MLRRVVVTGLGCVTPLGVGVQQTWRRLLAGESGVVSIADRKPRELWGQLPCTVAGVVPEGGPTKGTPQRGIDADTDDGLWRAERWVDAASQRRMARFAQFAVAAAEMALVEARWPGRGAGAEALERTGVTVGSGIGNMDDLCAESVRLAGGGDGGGPGGQATSGYRRVSPLLVPRLLINMAAGHIAQRHGFGGPNHAASTACTTGAHAVGDAARFVALGDADVMVAGGAEACVHPLALAGFGRARSLANVAARPAESCRPFDRARSGFVVAEGAAVLVLESLEHARARGAPILAELSGYGCSGDAYHMTAPRPDGSGALRAMRRALQTACLPPSAVDYINAHATGTPSGDAAEAAAIHTLMRLHDDGVARDADVTVSSTKGAVGHLLGAAGALEALFCVLAICNNIAPPTLNLENPDVGHNFNFVPQQAQHRRIDVALTNSFGFGGTNASLVFARVNDGDV